MRKIPVQPLNTDEWHQWIAACKDATKANIKAVKEGEKASIKSTLYRRKAIKDAFFFSKNAPFYGKCAYCEFPISDFQAGDIEHFRPKAVVTDEEDQTILLQDEGGKVILDGLGNPKAHPGYYWLGYDWTNLIPSCEACNRPRPESLGKRNRFPVVGSHAQSPGEEVNEIPLLINPASGQDDDDPQKHLIIDDETGLMIPLSDRGKMCIKILGLNQRDQLVMARKTTRDRAELLLTKLLDTARDLANPQRNITDVFNRLVAQIDELIGIWMGQEACTTAARQTFTSKGFSLEVLHQKRDEYERLSKVNLEGRSPNHLIEPDRV